MTVQDDPLSLPCPVTWTMGNARTDRMTNEGNRTGILEDLNQDKWTTTPGFDIFWSILIYLL